MRWMRRMRLASDKKVKPGGVAALVTADTLDDVVKPKSDQQSLMQGTFGIQGYGGGGQGPPLGHSQHPSYLSSGPGMSLSAQVQGSGGGVRQEVLNSNQQSSMQGSFASQFGNGGPSVGSSYGGNSGGLGLQEGPGGSFGYGVLGKGPPLGHLQHPLNLSSGGGSVMSSFGSSVVGMGSSTSGGLQPSSLRVDGGWFSDDSHLGGPGASYGGKGSGREAGLGLGFGPFGGRGSSYGGMESGGGTGLSTHGSQAPSSVGGDNGGRYGGSHFGSPGLSCGGMGSCGGVELGTRVSIIPSDNNNPSPEHLTKKQKLTDNTITPPPEPPSTTTTTETTTTDDLRKLIQQFTHSQLTELLITASLNHPDVLDDVRGLADSDITQRKLHVRDLDLKTTSASLRSVFAQYGELKSIGN